MHLERAFSALSRRIDDGKGPLCLSGGVALNGCANALLARSRPISVPFSAGDSGAAIGAAFVGHHLVGSGARRARISPYLGPTYDEASCRAAVEGKGLRVGRLDGDARVAEALVAGKILGFFDGPMEFGPRALGSRSILADPRPAAMRDVINARIKHREPFRPFAPVVLAERAAEYFELDHPVPFMTEVHPARPGARERVPAVVHVDGTSRVQTLERGAKARLYAILEEFAARTGVPMLLNTSFNVAGEPIVCSPSDAVRTFIDADLDALVLGPLWVERA
jgi:carbamoyltransferase